MKKSKYYTGLLYLVTVNVLWVLSAWLTKYIYEDRVVKQPFLITYYSNGMFSLYLIIYLPFICKRCTCKCSGTERSAAKEHGVFVAQTRDIRETSGAYPIIDVDFKAGERKESNLSIQSGTNLEDEISTVEEDGGHSCCLCCIAEQAACKWSLRKTFKYALSFSCLWFVMDYLSNLSLVFTTVGSSTLQSGTCGPFTLVLSIIFIKEPCFWINIMGVGSILAGSLMTLLYDNQNVGDLQYGDLIAIAAAFVYGCYSTLMKYFMNDENKVSMPLFVGLIGFCNLILLWPVFLLLYYMRWEILKTDKQNIGFMTLNGLSDLISDYLLLQAILLTSPVFASVWLCLSIPFAVIVDYMEERGNNDPMYFSGIIAILIGFVLVNLNAVQSLEPETDIKRSLITKDLPKEEQSISDDHNFR